MFNVCVLNNIFQGEYIFHVFCFTLPVNSWRNLCKRNNAFLFMQVVNSSRNNIPGLFRLFETKFNTTQLNTKGEFVGSELKWRKWQGCLAPRLSLPFPHLLVSACLYSLLLESFPNTEVHASESLCSHPVIFKMQEASGTLLCWCTKEIAGRSLTGITLITCDSLGQSLWVGGCGHLMGVALVTWKKSF